MNQHLTVQTREQLKQDWKRLRSDFFVALRLNESENAHNLRIVSVVGGLIGEHGLSGDAMVDAVRAVTNGTASDDVYQWIYEWLTHDYSDAPQLASARFVAFLRTWFQFYQLSTRCLTGPLKTAFVDEYNAHALAAVGSAFVPATGTVGKGAKRSHSRKAVPVDLSTVDPDVRHLVGKRDNELLRKLENSIVTKKQEKAELIAMKKAERKAGKQANAASAMALAVAAKAKSTAVSEKVKRVVRKNKRAVSAAGDEEIRRSAKPLGAIKVGTNVKRSAQSKSSGTKRKVDEDEDVDDKVDADDDEDDSGSNDSDSERDESSDDSDGRRKAKRLKKATTVHDLDDEDEYSE